MFSMVCLAFCESMLCTSVFNMLDLGFYVYFPPRDVLTKFKATVSRNTAGMSEKYSFD